MSQRWPGGLYGAGMHDYILTEIELGDRAALAADMEACEYGALIPDPKPELDVEAEAEL